MCEPADCVPHALSSLAWSVPAAHPRAAACAPGAPAAGGGADRLFDLVIAITFDSFRAPVAIVARLRAGGRIDRIRIDRLDRGVVAHRFPEIRVLVADMAVCRIA